MFVLAVERGQRVLRFTFSGVFTTGDLDAIDRTLIDFLAGEGAVYECLRCLYDMTDVTALAVPKSRFGLRARTPPIGNVQRVVVKPLGAGEDFGQSYREEESLSSHSQPVIVPTLGDAYDLLGLVDPCFEALA